MQSFRDFYTEKTVIGLTEWVTLAGIGKVLAKVDSGNGAHNVIHGEDITQQGNKILFTTCNNKKVSKNIEETININIGSGHVEERPVVLFRMKVGDKEFDNIPFSVANRHNNEHKILIGKDFIKQLDALIDVGAQEIAHKNIEVDI